MESERTANIDGRFASRERNRLYGISTVSSIVFYRIRPCGLEYRGVIGRGLESLNFVCIRSFDYVPRS